MSGPRLLVFSPSCHEPVNRAVFRNLASRGIPVHLAVPKRHFVGGAWRDTEIRPAEGYELSHLELRGTHLRLQRVVGLGAAIRHFEPTHIFIDADPASLLVLQAAWQASGAKLSALTAENLPAKTGTHLLEMLKSGKAMAAANLLLKAILRTLARLRLDRVFTLSDEGTRVAKIAGMPATKIPLGYDPDLFNIQPAERRAATRARLGLSEPTIAYFGRLVPEKGLHILVNALAQMKDLPWQFLVDKFSTASGNYGQEVVEALDLKGLSDRVIYFEARHEDMPDFMNAADLVVLPSITTPKWKEQYGRVIQEAQACGRIVIGSTSGAIPEVMDGQGYLFPEGDTKALADLLRIRLEGGNFVDPSAAESARRNRSIQRQADILEEYLFKV